MSSDRTRMQNARARRRRIRRLKATKVALAGASAATAVAVGLTPFMANAAVSETHVIGLPGWLPIDIPGVNLLPADPAAINGAVAALRDTDPITGLPTQLLGLPATPSVAIGPVWHTSFEWRGNFPKYETVVRGQWIDPRREPLFHLAESLALEVAPALNWTWYLQNANLIAYGDGAIAAGLAYQTIIDAVGAGDWVVGVPLTDPRDILVPGASSPDPDDPDFRNPIHQQIHPGLVNPGMSPRGEPVWRVVKPGGVIDISLLSLILLRNPGRPNGGLYARFAPIYEAVRGVDPVSPERIDVLPARVDPDLIARLLTGDTSGLTADDLGALLEALATDGDGKPTVVTAKVDATWAYDILSDAPATANPVAWLNSLASGIFLTNLLTGIDPTNPGGAPDGFTLSMYVVPVGERDAGTVYLTYAPNQLPLLAPLRLPAQLLSLVTGEDINTPVSDALEPFLRILTNIAYGDVVRNPDGSWERTLDRFHEAALFGTRTLTKDQALYLPGDLIAALGRGIGDELTDVLTRTLSRVVQFLNLFGIEVPQAQVEQLGELLGFPGEVIKTVSREIGTGVSELLHALEPVIPDLPAFTQSQLREGQSALAPVVAPVLQAADAIGSPIIAAAEDALGDVIRALFESLAGGRTTTLLATGTENATAAEAKFVQVPEQPLTATAFGTNDPLPPAEPNNAPVPQASEPEPTPTAELDTKLEHNTQNYAQNTVRNNLGDSVQNTKVQRLKPTLRRNGLNASPAGSPTWSSGVQADDNTGRELVGVTAVTDADRTTVAGQGDSTGRTTEETSADSSPED